MLAHAAAAHTKLVGGSGRAPLSAG